MNRRGFMKFLGALGFAPKVTKDAEVFECRTCKDRKLVAFHTVRSDDLCGLVLSDSLLDCPSCCDAKFVLCMQDFDKGEVEQIMRQIERLS